MVALWLALTLGAYLLGLWARQRWPSPLVNPTLIAAALLIPALLISQVPYAAYAGHVRPLSSLLAPAVVALAVPMYRQRSLLRRQWRALLLGGVAGTSFALGTAYLLSGLLHLERGVRLALAVSGATSPVALAVAGRLGGPPALAASLAIVAGLVGASLVPLWLALWRVRSPLALGLALGAVSHGIGTARAREEREPIGAAASLGMGLGALTVTLLGAVLAAL